MFGLWGYIQFQFHTGSIKRRLLARLRKPLGLRFNSILVRLKAVFSLSPDSVGIRFQFHTGSIKRFADVVGQVCTESFQFHTGSIKSLTIPVLCGVYVKSFNSILVRLKDMPRPAQGSFTVQFQFHTGSIKRKAKITDYREYFGFNSILVRLKGSNSAPYTSNPEMFQFHTGSIKS